MLNKEQKSIISIYISFLNPKIKKHLRDMRAINNNGTLSSWDDHKWIEEWFLNVLEVDGYTIEDNYRRSETVVVTEISNFDSHSGNPILFDFPAEEFEYFKYEVETIAEAEANA